MPNATSGLQSFLMDVVIPSTYDTLTRIAKTFGIDQNQFGYNSSHAQEMNTAITVEDIKFYLMLKLIWKIMVLLVAVVMVAMLLHSCYNFFFVPYNRIRRLGSIGYLNHEEGTQTKKDLANLIRRRRKVGDDIPPVYPNGWFRLLDSLQLNAGEVKEVTALGEHFAVFRSQSGKVSILDAYCPHMGGNLAVGGLVRDECLECPFHGWKFDGDGLCVEIPYSTKGRYLVVKDFDYGSGTVRNLNFVSSFKHFITCLVKIHPHAFNGCRIDALSSACHISSLAVCDDEDDRKKTNFNSESSKVPNFAKTKSWPCKEINGAIFVWYHCDGVEPEWEIPLIEEMANGDFTYKGRVEHHVNTHIQDLPENGSDQAHLSHLHVPSITAGNDLSKQFSSWLYVADHIFKAFSIGSKKETPHISSFDLIHYLEFFKKWKCFPIDFKVHQIGPGMVHLYFTSGLWKGVFIQHLTPQEPLHQVLTHNVYANWALPVCLAKILMYTEAVQVDRDVMIWNNKTFCAKPKLVKEDRLILQYRRWFSQFYTENSPKLKMKAEDDIQW